MTTTKLNSFTVQGFHCSGCSDNLSTALNNLDGVIRASVEFEGGQVQVRYDVDRLSEQEIRDRISASGFEAD